MPEHPVERRSGQQAKPKDLPTVFDHKASKPMTKMDRLATRVVALVLFGLVVAVFIRSHFMGPPHGGDHEVIQTVLEYGPLAIFSGLSIALFVRPEASIRMILHGLHRAIEVAPDLISQLRIFRKDRRDS